tara:strand:+ start:177 stop:572 length:396 start_codon:yes stop_codon:yes gene_type:complete
LLLEVISMPTVIYKGPHKCGRNAGSMGFWTWGKEEIRTQEWVNDNANGLVGNFLVDGVIFALSSIKEEEGNDGSPDMGWTKGDIMSWLEENNIEYSSLNTKAKLLAKVEAHLNPTKDSMSEGSMEQPTGDE